MVLCITQPFVCSFSHDVLEGCAGPCVSLSSTAVGWVRSVCWLAGGWVSVGFPGQTASVWPWFSCTGWGVDMFPNVWGRKLAVALLGHGKASVGEIKLNKTHESEHSDARDAARFQSLP